MCDDLKKLEEVLLDLDGLEVDYKNISEYFDLKEGYSDLREEEQPFIEKGKFVSIYGDGRIDDYYRLWTYHENFESYSFEGLIDDLRQYYNNDSIQNFDELGFVYTTTETDYNCNDNDFIIRKAESGRECTWEILGCGTNNKKFDNVDELIKYLQDKYN